MPKKNRPFDFCGWATVNDVKCSDGRTIRKNAFADNDGEEVPMVWQHLHNDPENVLGHALLENHDEGVYCYCWFNNNPKAQAAKEAVGNDDIKALSIYANQLVQRGNDVVHGQIREVSLVMTGANKGARIENLNFAHSDGSYDADDEEALIYTDEQDICLYHNDGHDPAEDAYEDDESAFEYDDDADDVDEEDVDEYDDIEEDEEDGNMDVQEILDGMTDEQLEVVNALYEQGQIDALQEVVDEVEDDYDEDDEDYADDELEDEIVDEDEEYEDEDEYDEVAHSMYGGYGSMKRNVFENETEPTVGNTLSHAETEAIFTDAKRSGSLKEAFLAHADDLGVENITYGVGNIDYLFPDYKNTSATPEFVKRDQNWVTDVMNAVHHSPFTRIKTIVADITPDEARALGYIKGNRKKEEVFTLLKRTTDPQTIYKKQKLDRDDVVDITDFDVVAWIKGEMRLMLDEEIARAILIGDGRATDSPDHIKQQHVRSIWQDDDLYTVKVPVTEVQGESFAKTVIKTIIRNRKNYKGSGNPVFFTTEEYLTEMLLIEDGMGHFMYKTLNELATQLRVSKIITVPVMENAGVRTDARTSTSYDLIGLIVNLNDYNVGADKGGSVNMFDDFDIDYNQQKYLIETRISGALVKPFSALAIE